MEPITVLGQPLHLSELLAVIFGIFYVILAARESIWCWFWGILSCSFWAFATYSLYNLYIDALLQVFYVGMGFFGIWQWLRGGQNTSELAVSKLSPTSHSVIILIGLVLSVAVGYFFSEYTQAAASYLDALTTVFSIIATLLIVRKIAENWLYWIVVDAIYVYLYFSRGSMLFTGLMVVYTLIALFGWIQWNRKVKTMV